MASSVVKELEDLTKLEKQVNDALQAASEGKLLPRPVSLASLPTPASHLTEAATAYAKSTLDPALFLHSMRTYYLGTAIATVNFRELEWDPETTYLAAMLHDLGLSPEALSQSGLSFELQGGLLARHFLVGHGASARVTDTVVEAVFRHKDNISDTFGHSPDCLLLILGSHLDVYGAFGALIHGNTVREIVTAFPRRNFNNVFPDLLREEVKVKRFCSAAGRVATGFLDNMRNNSTFSYYDR